MPHHERCQEDEVFVGNTSEGIPSHLSSIPGLRLGEVALDIEGKKLPPRYRPIFIKKGSDYERYNQIMEARFSAVRRGN